MNFSFRHLNPHDNKSVEIYDSSRRGHRFVEEIIGLVKYRFLIYELINRNIKIRYKRSALGVVWTMLNPLLSMLVLSLVFSQLFSISLPNYPLYLLSGLVLWTFFAQSTVASVRDLLWGGGVLTKKRIPKTVFAVAAVGTGIVNILLALGPLAIIMIIEGNEFHYSIFFLPIALLLAAIFALGIGLLVSSLAIGFTDVIEMYQILLLAWMYLTPIFYPKEILASNYQWIIELNPMLYFLECFRDPVYLGSLPSLPVIIKALLSAIISLIIGGYFFAKKSDQIPYKV